MNFKLRGLIPSVVLAGAFLVLALTVSVYAGTENGYQDLPVSVPFLIHKNGEKSEINFRVNKEDQYSYYLTFNYKSSIEERRLRELLQRAGSQVNNGEPIFAKVEIYEKTDALENNITSWEVSSLPLESWGHGHLTKVIYSERLLPGKYRAVVTATKDNPTFRGINVEFKVGLARKPK